MPTHQQNVQYWESDEPPILQAVGAARWHVLHTLSRQEKSLGEDLNLRGIHYYLPLVQRTHFYGRRKVISELPLFAGYLFLLGTIDQAYSADRTGRVARIIPVFDQDRLNWELRNLQMALHRHAALDLYPNMRAGVRVEVRAGPFRGLQGVIEGRIEKKNRLVLQVATLGKGVSLEIDGSLLDRLD
jgi:transcription antitermination factor NusG